jgi:hypothetical protein
MADTAALVVALSAQLTKFEKDMKQAGVLADDAVDNIEKKFSKMNPQVSASFLGNLFAGFADKAVGAAVQAVKELVDRFKELQNAAEYAEVSVQWLYGLQQAGEQAGASFTDMNAAMKAVAFSLDEIKRGGDNALKTLFDANPQFLKGINRDAMTAAQALQVVFNIMNNMSRLRAEDVGTNLGIPTGASIAAWKQGGDAIMAAADAAAKAGPDLKRLAEISQQFQEIVTAVWNEVKRTIVDDVVPKIKDSLTDLLDWMRFFQRALKEGPLDLSGAIKSVEAFQERVNSLPAITITPPKKQGGGAADPYARKAGTDERDPLGRASDQLDKHIALMEADTAAIGKNAGEQERLRAMAELTTAAQRAGVPITEEMRLAMEAQAETAGQTAQKLAVLKDQYNELNAASKEFGSALAEGFKAAVFEGKKLNEVLSQLLKRLANKLVDKAFDAIFASPAGGGSSFFMQLFGKQSGGPVNAGQPYVVGEKGPELMVPGAGGMVLPNDVLRTFGAGSGNAINYAPSIDARGASPEAVARLAQILEQDRAQFATKTIAVIQQARLGRVRGL